MTGNVSLARPGRTAALAALTLLLLLAAAGPASADLGGDGSGSAVMNTVGGMISALAKNITGPFSLLITGLGFLLGMGLIGSGLMKLAHAGDSHKAAVPDGFSRIAGGSALIGLPPMISAGVKSFYGSSVGSVTSDSTVLLSTTVDCMTAAGQGVALTCVAKNVALNVAPVFWSVLFGIAFLVGAATIAGALYGAATSHSTGQRMMPKGWAGKLILGCLLCNFPALFVAVESTMGISTGTIATSGFIGLSGSSVSSILAYKASASAQILQQYAELIGWLFVILSIFGALAFWKGIMCFKALAEGNQQSTMGAGITHIIGGVLLANGKFTVCLVVGTLMGQGLGFC